LYESRNVMRTKMSYKRDIPFNQLPPLPVDREKVETVATLRKSLAATAALAELKGLAHTLGNPNILLNAVILLEAKASSEIENIVTTHDKLYRSLNLKGKGPDSATWEVLRYRDAVKYGLEYIREHGFLHMRIVADIQKVMEMNDAGFRKLPGTRLLNAATGEAVYTPPDDPDVINSLLRNFDEHFNAGGDLCPLIRMGILHHQFESIHPFYDGNGRTGRILNLLYLLLHGLLDTPVLFLSGYVVRNQSDYYRGLQLVREKGEWETWICYILEMVERSSRETIRKIHEINNLVERTHYAWRQARPKLYDHGLVDLLFEQPYCRIEHVMMRMNVTRITASRYLGELVAAGLLVRKNEWKESLFINEPMMNLLGEW